jgi:hypothetical protein
VVDKLSADVEHGGVPDKDGDERVDIRPSPLSIIES